MKKEVEAHGLSFSDEYITRTCELIKEKISFVKEVWSMSEYFFIAPKVYDEAVITKRWNEKSPLVLTDLIANAKTFRSLRHQIWRQHTMRP
jgi:glutamyl-tRNA synthetase